MLTGQSKVRREIWLSSSQYLQRVPNPRSHDVLERDHHPTIGLQASRQSGFSLSLDHDFEVLARQHQRAVARTVAALHERQQVLGEGSLLLGVESAEGLVHRTVVGAEHV